MSNKNSNSESTMSNDEQTLIAVAFAVGMMLLILVVVWNSNHALISQTVGSYRLAQIWMISLFTGELDAVANWIRTTDPETVTWKQLSYVASAVGGYTRFLFIPLFVYCSWRLFKGDVRTNFSRTFDIHRLIKSQAELWPHLKVLIGLDLIKLNPLSGKWASPLTEHDLAIKFGLLNPDGSLNRPKTNGVLTEQLGAVWTGHQALKPHEKVLFAVLSARAAARGNENSKTEETINKWVDHLSSEMLKPVPDTAWADEMIAKCITNKHVAKITESHHYVYGVLISMIHKARESGVFLPSSHIMWLRPLDRQLFFTLNALTVDVGRGLAVWCEVCGTYSHWLAELKHGAPLKEPFLEPAFDGLNAALADFVMDEDKAEKIRRKINEDIELATVKIEVHNRHFSDVGRAPGSTGAGTKA